MTHQIHTSKATNVTTLALAAAERQLTHFAGLPSYAELLAIASQAHAAFGFLSARATTAEDREEFKRRYERAEAAMHLAAGKGVVISDEPLVSDEPVAHGSLTRMLYWKLDVVDDGPKWVEFSIDDEFLARLAGISDLLEMSTLEPEPVASGLTTEGINAGLWHARWRGQQNWLHEGNDQMDVRDGSLFVTRGLGESPEFFVEPRAMLEHSNEVMRAPSLSLSQLMHFHTEMPVDTPMYIEDGCVLQDDTSYFITQVLEGNEREEPYPAVQRSIG